MYFFYPVIKLNNNTTYVNIDYNPDITLSTRYKTVVPKYSIIKNIDIKKIGKQTLSVEIEYFLFKIDKKFDVYVKDKYKPNIELIGDSIVSLCPNIEYIEQGYKAFDNYDGNITNKVVIIKKDNDIFYNIIDSSGNMNDIKRTIVYEDKESPTIQLKGSDTVTLYVGNTYIDPGYEVIDNCDKNLNSKVIITNNVNYNIPGIYKIKYAVSDNSQNKASIERTIIIKNKEITNNNGVIYLTFDDGPSYLTKKILNILKEENIKATFFVVDVNEYTKQAYNMGHTIGLHSNSHNYSYIYKNKDNYFKDLIEISDKVYNYIGFRSNIIRFPGGSSNTISKKYNNGIMTYLSNEVIKRGFIYYDWNIDSKDASSGINNEKEIYNNVVNNLSVNKTNIVLMHDSIGHDATVLALKSIIEYGKNNGYVFKAITSDTPIVRHNINN